MFFFFEDEPVKNKTNKTNLEYIKITGLFGLHNIKLEFDNEVNIYIGENGLGKTTILNCIYYILTKRYDKLSEIDFNEINVKFKCEELISIDINDINKYNNRISRRRVYDEDIFFIISDIFNNYNIDNYNIEEKIEIATIKLYNITRMPLNMCRRAVLDYTNTGRININTKKGDYRKIEQLNKKLDELIDQRIIYLTTYRRIENDFSKSLRKGGDFLNNDNLIRFGMSDVEKSIENILNLIRENSRESFNKMTSVLLKQYSSFDGINKMHLSYTEIDMDMLKIILDRLGNEIAEVDKKKILSLLENKDIYKEKYLHLLNLIIKLIENYEKQKIYDEKINKFVNTCNKYLKDKHFIYNKSELKLDVKLDVYGVEDTTIELSKLSSGEKQIVSLFSQLYLENDKDSILIIDEPELSISMKWQRMLLPDIMRSDNCKLLLTVTHSPFIFENEFDNYANEMRNCIY